MLGIENAYAEVLSLPLWCLVVLLISLSSFRLCDFSLSGCLDVGSGFEIRLGGIGLRGLSRLSLLSTALSSDLKRAVTGFLDALGGDVCLRGSTLTDSFIELTHLRLKLIDVTALVDLGGIMSCDVTSHGAHAVLEVHKVEQEVGE